MNKNKNLVKNKTGSKGRKPYKNSKNGGPRSGQPKADSREKRVNYDNTREDKFERDMEKDHSNDISWYSKNPGMLKSAASVGFSNVVGEPLPFGYQETVPGILSIRWVPWLAGAGEVAFNQAAKAIYSFVVHANSRNQSYDPVDLMLVILAGKEVFNILSTVIRAYGVAKKYSAINRYTPDTLLQSMGFVPSDFRSNLADIWFDINEMIARATQLWIPRDIPLISREFWMNANVYYDANSVKAQYYLFNQEYYLMYNENTFTDGGALVPVEVTPSTSTEVFKPGTKTYTWEIWKDVINQMFSALLNSQDRGIMFGDIMKAYGKENLYAISEIDASYTVDYSYNEEVLTQIENCVPYFYASGNQAFGVKQTPEGELVPVFHRNGLASGVTQLGTPSDCPLHVEIMNFHGIEQPTPEMVMIASRMQAVGATPESIEHTPSWTTTGAKTTKIKVAVPSAAGTEVAVGLTILSRGKNNADEWVTCRQNLNSWTDTYSVSTTTASVTSPGEYFKEWAAFDWAPWVYGVSPVLDFVGWNAGSDMSTIPNFAMGDYDSYTTITANELNKLHTTAVYSELGIPVL